MRLEKFGSILLAMIFIVGWGNAQQMRPTHVVVIFDTTKSFWSTLPIAHAVTTRLLKELYFVLPGHPDDQVTFIALNAAPTIVTELSGLDLRREAARKFLEAYEKPDPRLGTDVVGALELADLAFSRNPQSIKFLFIFSDLRVDPARTSDGRIIPFRQLTEFDWHRFDDVNLWVFFCPPEMELKIKTDIPNLQRAQFFSLPPITNGVVEKANLKAFVDKLAQRFQTELAEQLKSRASPDPSGGVSIVWFSFIALAVMGGLIVLLAFLSRRGDADL